MSENNTSVKPIDQNKINISDPHESDYWTRELGVSKELLLEAVKKVGTSAAAVRRHIKVSRWNKAP